MTIGDNIKKIRKQHNLTQKQFADMLDLSTATIQSYELNRRTPPVDILQKISSLLSIDFKLLINKDDSSKISYANAELLSFTNLINEILDNGNKYTTETIYQILRLVKDCIVTANKNNSLHDVVYNLLLLSQKLEEDKK